MKISYNWLKDYLPLDMAPEQTGRVLTDIGLEVESMEIIESIPGGLQGVVTAKVLTCVPHPNSDHLHLTTVDTGEGDPVQVVCGDPNVVAGQKVLLATIGTVLNFTGGEQVKIKKGKIRGEDSYGMICAEDELGLGSSHEGIMVLPPETPVGVAAKEYLNLSSDVVFEIGLTPNRIDAASHLGVARDLSAWLAARGKQVQVRIPSVLSFSENPATKGVAVEVTASEAAPRYSGITLSNVSVAPSPDWMQNRLRAAGIRPINNVVDITNYVLLETGQPLHAFDRDKIREDKVIVRFADPGSVFVTLDGVKRTLDAQDLMICNGKYPMCIGGVFGGQDSGVTDTTKSLFLESAYFHPVYIRKTSKRHGLKTEASFRFERGADPGITLYALKRAVLLMQELCGAKTEGHITDIYPQPVEPVEVWLNYKRMFALMGKDIGHQKTDEILEALEMKILERREGEVLVRVPLYRVDVRRECDVVEDILRIYGYNNIELPAQVRASINQIPKPDQDRMKNDLANKLASAGFREIMCNSLTKAEYYAALETFNASDSVKILNPLSNDLNVMRQTLIWGGLETIAYNINRQQYDLRFFEQGNVYTYLSQADTPENAAEGKSLRAYREYPRLALFVTGNDKPQNWHSPAALVDFFFLKAYVEQLFGTYGLHIGILDYQPSPSDVYEEGVRYLFRGKVLADIGQVNNKLCRVLDIRQAVFAAEIAWDVFFSIIKNNSVRYSEMPRFPEVRRDLALVLEESVPYARLHEIAFKTEKKLLKKVQLFDVYRGNKIPEGTKQYALSFVLQDPEKTLTDTYVGQIMQRLLDAFAKETGAVLR